jgi:hypothetical protein
MERGGGEEAIDDWQGTAIGGAGGRAARWQSFSGRIEELTGPMLTFFRRSAAR